jgi:hypothetical protein
MIDATDPARKPAATRLDTASRPSGLAPKAATQHTLGRFVTTPIFTIEAGRSIWSSILPKMRA